MSRVFRRPMFRGGSTNMNGIMSGIEDRENFQEGTPSAREQLEKAYSEYPDTGISPLNQFLIQGGLSLMSQPSTGSLLGDIATAAKDPTSQLLKSLSEKGRIKRELALQGTALDIEQAGKERLLKQRIDAEAAKQTGNEIYDIYKGIRIEEAGGEVPEYVGDNFAFYNTEFRKKMRDNLPSEQIGGLLRYTVNPDDPRSVKEWEKKNKAKINAGQIYYYSEETGKPIVWNNKTKSFDTLSMDFSEVDTFDDNSVDTVGAGEEIEVLSFEDAKSLAGERGYVLIPPRPADAGRGWLADQKRKNPNAITKSELEDIIEKEQFAERYKNIKGNKQRTR